MQEKLWAVQRMQDYIEEHIYENMTLADLSAVSFFSPWYAYRLFKAYTHYSPSDYIRRLRLSKSALKMRDERCRIIDVAYEMGFQSVDGYQRAFMREFGVNPSEYAKRPMPLQLFIPYGVVYSKMIKEDYVMSEVKNVFIQVVHKPKRKVIIKRGMKATDYFDYCSEVGCDVWGILISMRSIGGEPVCLWLPEKYRKEGTSTYVQGVEVAIDDESEVPEGFDTIILPEADYMMFQGEPYEETRYCEAIMEVQEAIKKYQPEFTGYMWDDEKPRVQLEPIGKRGYIEMLPVKKQ